ncbi:NAD(P)-binding protein [Kitasatospora sp. NPDC091207]|uniref:NAD(P)-binding protein n=1 Tax=Kitasatospora sp. NPDC091207 TaxID=3364083 RepID=UPI0038171B7C
MGAGPAGLACAGDLVAAGRELLVEAGDAVAGRMRTDVVRGFRLDRGFQVFNPAYPQVRRRIDLGALRLYPFAPGFLVADGRGGRHRVAEHGGAAGGRARVFA